MLHAHADTIRLLQRWGYALNQAEINEAIRQREAFKANFWWEAQARGWTEEQTQAGYEEALRRLAAPQPAAGAR